MVSGAMMTVIKRHAHVRSISQGNMKGAGRFVQIIYPKSNIHSRFRPFSAYQVFSLYERGTLGHQWWLIMLKLLDTNSKAFQECCNKATSENRSRS